jgi:hypothetical protein
MVKAEGTYLLATGSDTDWTTVLSDWDFTFSLLADSIHDISGLPLQDNVSLIRNTNFTKIDISANSPSLRPFRAYMVDISGLIDDYTKFYMTEDASDKIHDIYVDDILGKTSYDTADICANQIKAVTMAQAVTSIAEQAFSSLPELTRVNIPKTVTSVGTKAFYNCSNLLSVTFEAGSQLDSIGEQAFYGTGLTSINIPSTVVSIGSEAFKGVSSLTSISIPAGVTSIGEQAFIGCSNLSHVTFTGDMIPPDISLNKFPPKSKNITAYYYNYDLSQTDIDMLEATFQYVHGPAKTLFTLKNNNFKVIDISGSLTDLSYLSNFTRDDIISVNVGTTVTSIGSWAFLQAFYLTSIIIPSSVTSIGSNAFYLAVELTSISIPASVTSIGSQAFQDALKMTSVTFEAGSQLTSIGSQAFFQASKFTSIIIPAGVTSIGESAFQWASGLTSVTFEADSSLNIIDSNAFDNASSLTSINIPVGVTSIGSNAFDNASSLTSVTFEAGSQLTSICYQHWLKCVQRGDKLGIDYHSS